MAASSKGSSTSVDLFDVRARAEESLLSPRVLEVVSRGQFVAGPLVAELERALAAAVGVVACATCASGSDALTLALRALGIGEGDIVFVPALGFIATPEAALRVGAQVRFVDVRADDLTLCPEALSRAAEELRESAPGRRAAVMVVDLFGVLADYSAIHRVCDEFQILLVEDAAQAFGGAQRGKRAGSFGQAAAVSFFPTKPLGCLGDGGAVLSEDPTVAETVRCLARHGRVGSGFERVGMNSRLDALQAAVLLDRLPHVDDRRDRRRAIAAHYDDLLPERWTALRVARAVDGAQALYVLLMEDANELSRAQRCLGEREIQCREYYERCLSEEPVFAGLRPEEEAVPNASNAAGRLLAVPGHASLTDGEVERVVDCLRSL